MYNSTQTSSPLSSSLPPSLPPSLSPSLSPPLSPLSPSLPLTLTPSSLSIITSISTHTSSQISPPHATQIETLLSTSPSSLPSAMSASSTSEKTWKSFSQLMLEQERLKTFSGWTNVFVNPVELAKAGFFYLKDCDKVQCIFCNGIVGDWEVGDIPITEHRRHFPRCVFVRGYNINNISGVDENNPPNATPGIDETGAYNYEMEMFSRPEKGYISRNLSSLGIHEHRAPIHPSYKNYQTRMKSYDFWPKSIPQKPETLAEAGFYYTYISDHVRCFSCDGGLRNWEVHDDPWIKHARWFDQCYYLTLMKGHKFVTECKMKMKQVPASPQLKNLQDKNRIEHRVVPAESNQFHNTVENKLNEPNMKMEIENRLEAVRICKICMDEEVGVVFLPCGHLLSCPKCAHSFEDCPVCRKKICVTVKIFYS